MAGVVGEQCDLENERERAVEREVSGGELVPASKALAFLPSTLCFLPMFCATQMLSTPGDKGGSSGILEGLVGWLKSEITTSS